MVAGTSTMRTIVASMRTAAATGPGVQRTRFTNRIATAPSKAQIPATANRAP